MPEYNPTWSPAGTIRLRSVIPFVLATIGFGGGFAIAIFYNVALRPLPVDPTVHVPQLTAAQPTEPPPSYATDGRGGIAFNAPETPDTPQTRATARAARLERIRIDNVMRICTGC